MKKDPDGDYAVFVVWSSQLGGAPRFVPDAMSLMPDRRAHHYWDAADRIGDLYRKLRLGEDTLELTEAAWDTYLLFDRNARWPAGSPPPEPAWWEHQLSVLPTERHLDPERFARKAAALREGPQSRPGGTSASSR